MHPKDGARLDARDGMDVGDEKRSRGGVLVVLAIGEPLITGKRRGRPFVANGRKVR